MTHKFQEKPQSSKENIQRFKTLKHCNSLLFSCFMGHFALLDPQQNTDPDPATQIIADPGSTILDKSWTCVFSDNTRRYNPGCGSTRLFQNQLQFRRLGQVLESRQFASPIAYIRQPPPQNRRLASLSVVQWMLKTVCANHFLVKIFVICVLLGACCKFLIFFTA